MVLMTRRVMRSVAVLLVVLLLAVVLLPSCAEDEALTDPFYATTIYTWNGTAWNIVGADAGGYVVGPASSTDHGLVRYDGVRFSDNDSFEWL